jgi:glycerol-3-phosphate dehydrogenase (NAD(P)+)
VIGLKKIAVFGSGSWGTAIALTLVRAGHRVALVGIFPEEINGIISRRENVPYLPGVPIPDEITPTTDLHELEAEAVFLSVPSHAVRESARLIKPYLRQGCIIINTAKGLEENTHLRLSRS